MKLDLKVTGQLLNNRAIDQFTGCEIVQLETGTLPKVQVGPTTFAEPGEQFGRAIIDTDDVLEKLWADRKGTYDKLHAQLVAAAPNVDPKTFKTMVTVRGDPFKMDGEQNLTGKVLVLELISITVFVYGGAVMKSTASGADVIGAP